MANPSTLEPDVLAAPRDGTGLPRLLQVGDTVAPQAPTTLGETGVDTADLADLTLKLAATVPQLSGDWAARRLHLPLPLVHELLDQLRVDRLLDVLGQVGPFNYRYAIGQRGRERAARLFEISGYVGPAPVSLAAYAALLDWQLARCPPVTPAHVADALAELVLAEEAALLAGLAISSGRSLFVFGPPGNGKTSLGRLLHNALQGELWIPYGIAVGGNLIRIFDPQSHRPADPVAGPAGAVDQRWVRVRRPLIVLGTELTMDSFELTYSPALRFYEAPLHVKANGGTLLIDDFGREIIEPRQLLNRWITPLEHRIDYLTLHTGQKLEVPVRLMLIIATNLNPEAVMDAAFLRRMGYRLHLGYPTPEQYVQIFDRYAQKWDLPAEPGLAARLVERYRAEGRELRCCEPRDLIERARDICSFRGQAAELNADVLHLAWRGYFGNA